MNKKILSMLMALGLITGVGTYGTYAYFTDADQLEQKVEMKMGTLDVTTYWAGEGLTSWTPTNKATEVVVKDDGQTLSFDNVKPGDTFERDVIIANYGSLKGDVTVAVNPTILNKLNVEMTNVTSQTGNVQIDNEGRAYEHAVAPNGGFIRLTVKVTVPTEAGNDWMNTVINTSVEDMIKADVHQTIY